MGKVTRPAAGALLAVIVAAALGACGGGSSSSSGSGSGADAGGSGGGTVKMLMGIPPQSLDPVGDYVTQGSEVNWLVYTGLTTYARENGPEGAGLIPGLATALPEVTDGGRTYSATLRRGLVYSDGREVKASDFKRTVERAIKIPWAASGQFLTPLIVGGEDFAKGKADGIAGIEADDASGRIAIHLTKPYGAFNNILAFPALGLVPSDTPFRNSPKSPPPGVGPYMTKSIVPGVSFSVVRNPRWAGMDIPDIPAGYVDIDVRVSSNISANALSVLQGSADVFDFADVIPGSLLPQIRAQASDRFSMENLGNTTYFMFLNATVKPFSSQLAREAVVTGLDREAMARLASGTLTPACYYLPPALPGHVDEPCPYGDLENGDLEKARELVKQSGMEGESVTVWSPTVSPRQQWVTYYTQFLNSIGFRAKQKVLADATYYATIGNLKLHPQTGFTGFGMDFPNPVNFYLPLSATAILPTNNQNFSELDDPKINRMIAELGQTPTNELGPILPKWEQLEKYVADKAYLGVFGYKQVPKFTSDRIDQSALDFHAVYGWDLSSFKLK